MFTISQKNNNSETKHTHNEHNGDSFMHVRKLQCLCFENQHIYNLQKCISITEIIVLDHKNKEKLKFELNKIAFLQPFL